MREIDEKLQAKLDSGATSLCRCWLLQRRDGVQMGFTDHDRALTFDGITFNADSGMDTSVLDTSTGLSVNNAQVMGALQAECLSEEDIAAGKFDGADVTHWLVDWQDTELRILLFRGSLGEIRRGDGAFEVELRGLAEDLNKPLGRNYLRECDRVLGDEKCRVDLDDPLYSANAPILATIGKNILQLDGLSNYAKHWFDDGSLRWPDGTVSLIKQDRIDGDKRLIELWEEPKFAIEIGGLVNITAGCNRRAETCRAKFANFLNFRGFPHIPGEDWVMAYPSSEETNDDGSLSDKITDLGIFDG